MILGSESVLEIVGFAASGRVSLRTVGGGPGDTLGEPLVRELARGGGGGLELWLLA